MIYPILKGVLCEIILWGPVGHAGLAETIRTWPAPTMQHTWNQEQPDEAVCLFRTHFGHDIAVVRNSVQRRDRRIVPAVVQNQLASPLVKLREVGVGGIQDAP